MSYTVRRFDTEVQPIFVRPEVAAEMLGITRNKVFELLKNGELKSVRNGKRRLISRASIEEWAAQKLDAEE